MSEEAYRKVIAQKFAQQQAEQRAMKPLAVAQKVFREWLGCYKGFGAAIDPFEGAELVKRIEAAIVAERAIDNGQ